MAESNSLRRPRKKSSQDEYKEENIHKKLSASIIESINKIDDSDEDMFKSQEVESSQTEYVANSSTITFNDMPPLEGELLHVIHHTPKYSLPLNLYDKKYLKQPLKKRVSNLYSYYECLNAKIAAKAKKSFISAPKPKDILSSTNFNGTLFKNHASSQDCYTGFQDMDEIDNQNDNLENIYISRAGRQIKRKKYTEDMEEEANNSKKSKDSEAKEWIAKKSKVNDGASKKTAPEKVPAASLETPKTNSARKNRHEDTIKKTSLLTESEKRDMLGNFSKKDSPLSAKKNPRTRSELMFDNLRDDVTKRKDDERKMEIFQQSIDCAALDDDNDFEPFEKTEVVERRRVIPPSGRRPINSQKSSASTSAVKKVETDARRSPRKLKTTNSAKTISISNKIMPDTTLNKADSPSNNRQSQNTIDSVNKIDCPICLLPFSQSEIENHASNCGENEVETRSRARVGDLQTMTCHFCDTVLPLNTDYEVHVRDCPQRK